MISLLFLGLCHNGNGQSAQLQSAVQDIWFNTLATKMHLSTAQFELYPGTAALGSTSAWMWQIFNAIPAKSTDHYYIPQQANTFSFDYSLILGSMRSGAMNDMLNDANLMLSSANGNYVWNKTITNLKSALASGSQLHIDTAINVTYISDSTSGVKNQAVVIMQVQFNKFTVFYASPYSKADSLNQDLSLYKPWFDQPVFWQAFNVSDNTVWDPQQPVNWQKAFGMGGFMQNMCIALVAADGVSMKISIEAPGMQNAEGILLSDSSKNSPGKAPVIYTSGNGTDSSYADNQGNFIYSVSIPQGNPVLLGVLVCPMDTFVNHPRNLFTGMPSLR